MSSNNANPQTNDQCMTLCKQLACPIMRQQCQMFCDASDKMAQTTPSECKQQCDKIECPMLKTVCYQNCQQKN
jgi:hypothetical protein